MNNETPMQPDEDQTQVEVEVAGKKVKQKFERTSTLQGTVEGVVSDAWSEITTLGEEFLDISDYEQARTEAEELPDALNEIADEIEGMSFPGMFG
jgi:hypothetical protein